MGILLSMVLYGIWHTRFQWLPMVATSLDISDPLKPAQAVVILPGSEETRPHIAAGLMKAGYADFAFIPETQVNSGAPEIRGIASTKNNRRILTQRGIAEDRIVTLNGVSDSTYGDAIALERYFQHAKAVDVIIVTNAFHSRRARWAFRHVLPEHQSHLRFYSAPNGFDANCWWTDRQGRYDVLTEWAKLVCYVMTYGHGWLWCVSLASVPVTISLAKHHANRCRAQETEHVGVCHATQPKHGT